MDSGTASTTTIQLNNGWLFGGAFAWGMEQPGFDDSGFERVTLPHANAVFSWRDIDRQRYEYVSIYRRHFTLPAGLRHQRVFVDFEGAMAASTVYLNGEILGEYRGGYTPFYFELTPHINWGADNVLAVKLDSRRTRGDVPPFGGRRLDFDTFGGIYREVSLRVVPQTFIEDVFVRPADVLDEGRQLRVRCFLEGIGRADGALSVEARLYDGRRAISEAGVAAEYSRVDLSLEGLGEIELWDLDRPRLYDLEVRLFRDGLPLHSYRTRTGFREARFTPEGFFLNGRRVKLFGLNRHQLFPYVGNAMPRRAQRKDAEILKYELNCNAVRTAHYVQSRHFLDACDELGLLIWDEMPGWHHVGGREWKEAAFESARKMILRDRNRPSVVLWAVRINESDRDHREFYDSLNRLAHELDGSRQTTGAYHKKNHPLRQDVWGQNDYNFPISPPGQPLYLVSEAVGQKEPGRGRGFRRYYRRTDPQGIQQVQAKRHASAHNVAASDERYAGVLAWLAFDYNSPVNSFQDIKTPGVCDIFRIPKPGASFYRSQVDPAIKPVIEPAFYWDFGPNSPPDGPGEDAMICSNCERLELYVGGEHFATLQPDRERYGNLPYPPFFADLRADGKTLPELRIDGFVREQKVVSRSFSAETREDRLLLEADDRKLVADGADATRLVFRATDRYGAPRPYVGGEVRLELEGPGEIIGDNPFDLGPAGGAGAVWVRSIEGEAGSISVRAVHRSLGSGEVTIEVEP